MGPREVEVEPGFKIRLLEGGTYVRHVGLRRALFHWRCAREVERLADRIGPPEAIVVAMPTPGLCAAGARMRRRHGSRLIIDIRDLWPDVYQESVPAILSPVVAPLVRYVRGKNSRAFREANALIGVAPSYTRWAVDVAGPRFSGLSETVPLGCEELVAKMANVPPSCIAEWRAKLGLEDDCLVVLFMGTIGRQFDLEVVVEAARLLGERGLGRVVFVIAGAGDGLKRVAGLARLVPSVRCVGWVRGMDRLALLQLADVGLAPYSAGSKMSLPNKPFEYMAARLPVLHSLPGELRDIVGEAGCGSYYVANCPQSLVVAFEGLISKDLNGCSENAHQAYRESYRPDVVYARFARLVEDVVGGN